MARSQLGCAARRAQRRATYSCLGGAVGEQLDELSQHMIAFAAGEGERELREQQAIRCTDVIAATGEENAR